MSFDFELDHSYHASAGLGGGMPYAFALRFHDRFEGLRTHRQVNEKSFERNRIDYDLWYDAFAREPRQIELVTASADDSLSHRTVASARRIDGPVSPKAATSTPVAVWTEQAEDGVWRLVLFEADTPRELITSDIPLKNPAVCCHEGGCIVAVESEAESGGVVAVFDAEGRWLGSVSGRRPGLASLGGAVVVLVEQFVDDAFQLVLSALRNGEGQVVSTIRGDAGAYALNADLLCEEDAGGLLLAYEVSPKWGTNERCGYDRELRLERVSPCGAITRMAEHRLERLAVTRDYPQPVIPVRPKLFAGGGKTLLTYKTFALKHDHKQTGWHLWGCDVSEEGLGVPKRLSKHQQAMDTGYGVIVGEESLALAVPCVYQQLDWGPSIRHWLHVSTLHAPIEQENPEAYALSPCGALPTFNRIARPVELPGAAGEGHLLWCDPHIHSQYSKCESCDGAPDEKIRYQRDVLGVDVLSLADHVPGMSGIEYVWTFDRLEREGGHDGLVLYGNECNSTPGRHTIYYSMKREVADRFRCAHGSIDHPDRAAAYRFVREAIPAGEMIVVRHAHLNSPHLDAVDEETFADSFDPRLEPACEAIQSRGDALIPHLAHPGAEYTPFPNHYLDAGLQVGLLAGTDHSAGNGEVHYGQSGFWCRDRSPASVWEAIGQRRTIAVCNARIALRAWCNGAEMGETVESRVPLSIRVVAACAEGIETIGILQNGEMVLSRDVGADTVDTTLTLDNCAPGSWVVVTAICRSAYGEPAYAHASPFFVR